MRIIFISLAVLVSFFATAEDKAIPQIKWGYSGDSAPEKWGGLSSTFAVCEVGKQQSPINIKNITLDRGKALTINYQPVTVYISNDALGARKQDSKWITKIDNWHTTQLYFSEVPEEESVTFGGVKYRLIDEHFHRPSEHLLAGERFPVEIHFVHENEANELLVIGVFIKEGTHENEGIGAILNALGAFTNVPQEKTQIVKATLNPQSMFPRRHSYYEYIGSLTTPPCTENVRWLVMSVPIEVSAEQLRMLETLIPEANSRPVQLINEREVREFLSD